MRKSNVRLLVLGLSCSTLFAACGRSTDAELASDGTKPHGRIIGIDNEATKKANAPESRFPESIAQKKLRIETMTGEFVGVDASGRKLEMVNGSDQFKYTQYEIEFNQASFKNGYDVKFTTFEKDTPAASRKVSSLFLVRGPDDESANSQEFLYMSDLGGPTSPNFIMLTVILTQKGKDDDLGDRVEINKFNGKTLLPLYEESLAKPFDPDMEELFRMILTLQRSGNSGISYKPADGAPPESSREGVRNSN